MFGCIQGSHTQFSAIHALYKRLEDAVCCIVWFLDAPMWLWVSTGDPSLKKEDSSAFESSLNLQEVDATSFHFCRQWLSRVPMGTSSPTPPADNNPCFNIFSPVSCFAQGTLPVHPCVLMLPSH